MGGENELARKGSGKGKAMKGGTVFSEEDRELLLLFTVLLTIMFTDLWFFFKNLIQNTTYIGHSWNHVALITLFLRKPNWRQ